MVDRAELRQLAGWAIRAKNANGSRTAFHTAASPDAVLGLLDEIERLREEAKQALVIVGNVGRELGQTQHERDQLRAVAVRLKGALENISKNMTTIHAAHGLCFNVLADPEVEKL